MKTVKDIELELGFTAPELWGGPIVVVGANDVESRVAKIGKVAGPNGKVSLYLELVDNIEKEDKGQ